MFSVKLFNLLGDYVSSEIKLSIFFREMFGSIYKCDGSDNAGWVCAVIDITMKAQIVGEHEIG